MLYFQLAWSSAAPRRGLDGGGVVMVVSLYVYNADGMSCKRVSSPLLLMRMHGPGMGVKPPLAPMDAPLPPVCAPQYHTCVCNPPAGCRAAWQESAKRECKLAWKWMQCASPFASHDTFWMQCAGCVRAVRGTSLRHLGPAQCSPGTSHTVSGAAAKGALHAIACSGQGHLRQTTCLRTRPNPALSPALDSRDPRGSSFQ